MAKEDFRSGFVAILGRPNVGKSTLLNRLIKNKVSIVSKIPQTTRYQIRGILNSKDAQIIFVDTPGIHLFRDKLAAHLNTIAKKSISDCDLILYVVDTSRGPAQEEEVIMNILTTSKTKIIMVLNKFDLRGEFLNSYIDRWRKTIKEKGKGSDDPLLYYLPVSAKTGKNIDKLRELIVENLPAGPSLYEADTLTDFPLKFRIADIIREKLFLNLKKELPHSLAVEIESTEDKEKFIEIRANIYAKRNSQKKIIIGQSGSMLKEIGTEARLDIEKIYGKKVYLELWVKVLEDWQENPRILKELGYWWA